MHLKMLSAEWRPFYPEGDEFIADVKVSQNIMH